MEDNVNGKTNTDNSPVYDTLNAGYRFGLLNDIAMMSSGSKNLATKGGWSRLVWERAWKLDHAYWESISSINDDCKLLYGTISATRYLTLWSISDAFFSLIEMCENMAKIL